MARNKVLHSIWNLLSKIPFIALVAEACTYRLHFRTVLLRTWMARFGDEGISICKTDPPNFDGSESERKTAMAQRLLDVMLGVRLAERTLRNAESYKSEAKKPFVRAGRWFAFFFILVLALSPWPWFSTLLTLAAVVMVYIVFNNDFGIRGVLANILPYSISAEDKQIAVQLVSKTIVRTYTADASVDLRDPWRVLLLDALGHPVSEQITETDLVTPYFYNTVKEAVAEVRGAQFLAFVFNCLLYLILFTIVVGLLFGAVNLLHQPWTIYFPDPKLLAAMVTSVSAALALLGLIISFTKPKHHELMSRMRQLEFVSKRCNDADAIANGFHVNARQTEKARRTQIENAKKDESRFLQLGESTGALYKRYDCLAPSMAGLPFGLSVNDLSEHMLILGGNWHSVSAGVFRPLLRQWLNFQLGGLLVLSGKEGLPEEIRNKEYQLIPPESIPINPIENLTPEDVADTIFDLNNKNGEANPTALLASKLIRAAAHAVVATNQPYTLKKIYLLTVNPSARRGLIQQLSKLTPEELTSMSPAQQGSVSFLRKEFDLIPELLRDNAINLAAIWLYQIVDHEILAKWANSQTGIPIESVTEGKKIGISLPALRYGNAGRLASAFIKKRLYNAILKRGKTWQKTEKQMPVLLAIDEFQELGTKDETQLLHNLTTGGLCCLFNSQYVDSVQVRVGDLYSDQLLGNFKSLIGLRQQSEKTGEYVSRRMGTSIKPRIERSPAFDSVSHRIHKALQSPLAAYHEESSGLLSKLKKAGYRLATLPADIYRFMVLPDKHPNRQLRLKSGSDELLALSSTTSLDASQIDTDALAQQAPLTEQAQASRQAFKNQTVGNYRNIEPEEINALLVAPNMALAQVMRGKVQRRDLISLQPLERV